MKKQTNYHKEKKNGFTGFLEGLGKAFVKYVGNPFETLDNSNSMCYDKSMNGITINIVQPRRSVNNTSNGSVSIAQRQNNKTQEYSCTTDKLLPSTVAIGKNETLGKNCLCACNVLRNYPRVADWLIENFGSKCEEVTNLWVKSMKVKTGMTMNGTPIYKTDIDVLPDRPIISDEYNHMLVFYSEDKNYLNYIKFELNKRLDRIAELDRAVAVQPTKEGNLDLFSRVMKTMVEEDGADFENDDHLNNIINKVAHDFGLSEDDIAKLIEESKKNI